MSNKKEAPKNITIDNAIHEWMNDPLHWFEWRGESTIPTESVKVLSPVRLGDRVALVNWTGQNEDILIRSIEEFGQLAANIASHTNGTSIEMVRSGSKDVINIYAWKGEAQLSFRPYFSFEVKGIVPDQGIAKGEPHQ